MKHAVNSQKVKAMLNFDPSSPLEDYSIGNLNKDLALIFQCNRRLIDPHGSFNTNIAIYEHGTAQRAMWLSPPMYHKDFGLEDEFHQWTSRLTKEDVTGVKNQLSKLNSLFLNFAPPEVDPNEYCFQSMTFWFEGEPGTIRFPYRPDDLYEFYGEERVTGFKNIVQRICGLVPQRTEVFLDPFHE